ncbi:MAG: hypothetical protein ACI4JC_10765, partial [Faecalibacterium sp.]
MNIHEIVLEGYRARGRDNAPLEFGTSGSAGLEQLHVRRGESWKELTVRAVFHPCRVELLLPEDGVLEVPWEATEKPLARGQGRIVFQGVRDGVVCNTLDLLYVVSGHSQTEGVGAQERTLGITETILNKMEDFRAEVAQNAQVAQSSSQAAQSSAEMAAQNAQVAVSSAAAAAESESAAATSATNARNREVSAAASAAQAQEKAEEAISSASAAQNAAQSAGESEANAASSASAAAASAQSAGASQADAAASVGTAAEAAQTAVEKAAEASSSAAAAADSQSAAASSAASAEAAAQRAEALAPETVVSSVNGKTGTVTL